MLHTTLTISFAKMMFKSQALVLLVTLTVLSFGAWGATGMRFVSLQYKKYFSMDSDNCVILMKAEI